MRFLWWRGRRELVCRQAVELVTAYLDGALPADERDRFEAHLAACPHCTAYLDQMRLTVATVGRLDAAELPAEVVDELVDLYRRTR